jgi:hypothetical protein
MALTLLAALRAASSTSRRQLTESALAIDARFVGDGCGGGVTSPRLSSELLSDIAETTEA